MNRPEDRTADTGNPRPEGLKSASRDEGEISAQEIALESRGYRDYLMTLDRETVLPIYCALISRDPSLPALLSPDALGEYHFDQISERLGLLAHLACATAAQLTNAQGRVPRDDQLP